MPDILAELPAYGPRIGIPCVVSKLNPELRAQFDLALPTDHFASSIARWFAAHGHPEIKSDTVGRHRRGVCLACRTT